jgi:hypothetical protein
MDKYDQAFQKFNGSADAVDKYDAAFQKYGQKSAAYGEGKQSNSSLQGLVAAVNGPLMGFGDEVLAALGTPLKSLVNGQSMGENYRELRDGYRGMIDARTEEAPVTTALTQAATSAPMLVLNPLGKVFGAAKSAIPLLRSAPVAAKVGGMLPRAANAAASGFGYGTVQGMGDSTSEDAQGVLEDGLASGATGAVLSGAMSPVASVLGAGVRNVQQRISPSAALGYAKQKVAEAISRDARGTVFQSGQSNPVAQASARMGKLGQEATIADAAGQNTKQLLDTISTLPGRTKDAAEQLIHSRQAGRAGRLIAAADSGLSAGGERMSPQVERWVTQRQNDAAPIYNRLRETTVSPSTSLQSIVSAADDLGAVGLGREMSTARQIPFTLDAKTPGTWSMNDLDHVKQGLDQKIAKQWDPVEGKLTPLGTAYQDLKSKLVQELDHATTDSKTGVSLYKSARDAFAGPSALIDAAQQGRAALTKDGTSIARITNELSQSELHAFRLGSFEALRNKFGKESGQTEILKMWKEPATRERLKEIFGDEFKFRSFAANVAKEAQLKGLESVGRGSQTAARQFGAGDLDVGALTDAGGAFAAAKTGNVVGALGAARNLWTNIATPESVRNEMGGLLMSKGAVGQENLHGLTDLIQRINAQHNIYSQGLGGAVGSQIGSRLAEPLQVRGLLSTQP